VDISFAVTDLDGVKHDFEDGLDKSNLKTIQVVFYKFLEWYVKENKVDQYKKLLDTKLTQSKSQKTK
jgi:hypothetical protein